MEGSIPLNSNHDNKERAAAPGGGVFHRGHSLGPDFGDLFNFLATQIVNAHPGGPLPEFIDMVNQDKVATAELTLNKITFYLKRTSPAYMGGAPRRRAARTWAKVLAQQMEQGATRYVTAPVAIGEGGHRPHPPAEGA